MLRAARSVVRDDSEEIFSFRMSNNQGMCVRILAARNVPELFKRTALL
jgi:hypothetical protein